MMILLFLFASQLAPVVTQREVLAMMAEIPNCERACAAKGAYATAGDAAEVALAISLSARSRKEAAEEAVYAAYESGNRKLAVSPDGRDRGAWQLRDAGEAAFDPARAVLLWRAAADASRALCAANPPEERLAALASGSCSAGRQKVRLRDAVAERIAR